MMRGKPSKGREWLDHDRARRRRELMNDPHVSLKGFPLIISDAEHKVLIGAARGETAAETARRLFMAVDTVKTHRMLAFRKMGARNIVHAVAIAVTAGWITESDFKEKRRGGHVVRWNFDADMDNPLTARRIPVTSLNPVWGYFVAFDKASLRSPSEPEIRAIQSFIAEIRREWEMLMRESGIAHHPFDWFPGYNTVVLRKYAPGDWGYRRRFRRETPFFPSPPRTRPSTQRPRSLIEVMDLVRMNTHTGLISEEWILWKKRHPEVFKEFDRKETGHEEDPDA